MKIQIHHELSYEYNDAVYLEPHYLYLTPRESSILKIRKYDLEISPKPNVLSENLDAEGNVQKIAFFKEPAERLLIKVFTEVETLDFNPFEFVYYPFDSNNLPVNYPESIKKSLGLYLTLEGVTTLVDQTARQIAASAGWSTSKFLTELSNFIFKGFAYEIREDGAPYSPETTLLSRSGSCRDYAVLYCAMCRAMGIASRFVSGYYLANVDPLAPSQDQYLHAWVEVYLPGGGWRGFDPTQNQVVSGSHVPLASSVVPELITPVSGTYRGSGNGFLATKVKIKEA